jgi:two-component system, NtrC family, sensor histidine kinase HydH
VRQSAADSVRHYAGLASAGQLSSLVFRQIRHPIRQIRSELDLATADLAGGDVDGEAIEDAQRSIAMVIQHIETIEKRIEKLDPLAVGGRGRRVTDLNLQDVLGDVVEAYAEECDRVGVAIDLQGDRDLKVKTNREVAQHSFAGLIENAIWWARQGDADSPIVQVRLKEKGFTVSDNGPGVPENIATAIFEPHFTTRDGALGLGLTLVKDLLKSIGGSVRLTKRKPPTFDVKLEA